MDREIARLNFEGKLQAVSEEKGKPEQLLSFGPWTACVTYGTVRNRIGNGNPEPVGRALVAQLGDNRFLVAGFFCRVEFRPTDGQGTSTGSSCAWKRALTQTVSSNRFASGTATRPTGASTSLLSRWCCASRWPPIPPKRPGKRPAEA